jgi:hypothetical protein
MDTQFEGVCKWLSASLLKGAPEPKMPQLVLGAFELFKPLLRYCSRTSPGEAVYISPVTIGQRGVLRDRGAFCLEDDA